MRRRGQQKARIFSGRQAHFFIETPAISADQPRKAHSLWS